MRDCDHDHETFTHAYEPSASLPVVCCTPVRWSCCQFAFANRRIGALSSHSEPPIETVKVALEMAYLVKKLLAALRPDNYRWFAELLLTRVLQAAVLGEADDEVIGLARSNSAKMQGLQQRLSGPARLERSAGGRGPGAVHGAVDHG